MVGMRPPGDRAVKLSQRDGEHHEVAGIPCDVDVGEDGEHDHERERRECHRRVWRRQVADERPAPVRMAVPKRKSMARNPPMPAFIQIQRMELWVMY